MLVFMTPFPLFASERMYSSSSMPLLVFGFDDFNIFIILFQVLSLAPSIAFDDLEKSDPTLTSPATKLYSRQVFPSF